ncbi:MAG TPA: peptidoglycan-binding domain-containing protein, partial [Pirellulaceae bacterium]|nr:peptidoglycan-binding domain-containing protein [Pirellulaceae bacterium]
MIFQSKWFTHPRFQEAASGHSTIKSGERGDAVKTLQKALIELGYALPISTQKSGSPDGIFGSETDQAVKAFQKLALPNETPDGKVGPKTLAQLDARLAAKPAPKSSEIVWGDAPPGIPGKPKEVDLGATLGFNSAVKQHHNMSCWAACLSYWGKHCGGGRPRLAQGQITALYGHLASAGGQLTGGMPTGKLKSILKDAAIAENTESLGGAKLNWNTFVWDPYTASNLTYDWLKQNASGPNKAIYFGYTIGGASHINIIGHYDLEETSYVWAMEPWDGRFKLREI